MIPTIPTTAQRVFHHTPEHMNTCIDERTRESVARYAAASPQLLDQRLRELDHEWDVERVTETGSSLALLAGIGLAAALSGWWLLVPAAMAAFLLLHAVMGWSPFLRFVRARGYRTAREIDHERCALKALRGDFQPVATVTTPQDREDLSRFEGEGGACVVDPIPDAGDAEVVEAAIRAARS
jgi:hypothetical protein